MIKFKELKIGHKFWIKQHGEEEWGIKIEETKLKDYTSNAVLTQIRPMADKEESFYMGNIDDSYLVSDLGEV